MAGRLHGLDALRGIAALVVAWHHLVEPYRIAGPPVAAISAVDLFLIISGFVMARTYEHRMPDPRAFLLIRYRRLLPVMTFGTSVGAAAIMLDHGPSVQLASVYLMTVVFLPIGFFAVNLPAWSLFTEVLANYLHSRIFGGLSVRALILLAVALAAAFIAGTLVAGRVTWGSDYPSLLVATLRCLYCYVIGILVFRIWGEAPLGASPVLALAASALLLLFGNAMNAILFSILFAVFAGPLIVRAVLGLRASRIATAAGELSFPLYAVHAPVIMLALSFGAGPGLAASGALLLGGAIAFLATGHRNPRKPAYAGMAGLHS